MKNQPENQYLNFFYYLSILNKYKKEILLTTAAGLALGIVTVLRSPQMYSARVTLLLTGGGGGDISSALSAYGVPTLSGGGGSRDTIVALLQSARMRKAISTKFKLGERPPIGLNLNTYEIAGGMAIEAVCNDADLVVKISNFCVENLDAMNEELKIGTERPMVKVLDPAEGSAPIGKGSARRIFGGAFLCFIVSFALAIFIEHLRQLNRQL